MVVRWWFFRTTTTTTATAVVGRFKEGDYRHELAARRERDTATKKMTRHGFLDE